MSCALPQTLKLNLVEEEGLEPSTFYSDNQLRRSTTELLLDNGVSYSRRELVWRQGFAKSHYKWQIFYEILSRY